MEKNKKNEELQSRREFFKRAAKNILYACSHSNNVWSDADYKKVGIEEVVKANS